MVVANTGGKASQYLVHLQTVDLCSFRGEPKRAKELLIGLDGNPHRVSRQGYEREKDS